MAVILWHNPRCSKSRQALALLEEAGIAPEIRLYLKDPPTAEEISQVLDLLNRPALDLVRRKDAAFADADLTADSPADALIAAMAADPRLIERPVAISGTRAVIGRPPEDVLTLT